MDTEKIISCKKCGTTATLLPRADFDNQYFLPLGWTWTEKRFDGPLVCRSCNPPINWETVTYGLGGEHDDGKPGRSRRD